MSDDEYLDYEDDEENLDDYDDDSEEADAYEEDEDSQDISEITGKEIEYRLLTQEELSKAYDEEMKKVANLMSIPSSVARIFLTHYKWDVESLLAKYLDYGQEYIEKQAGFSGSSSSSSASSGAGASFSCPCCFDDVKLAETTALDCGHRFCNECWKQGLRTKIKDGESTTVTCMASKCHTPFPEHLVLDFFSEESSVVGRYKRFLLDSYVVDNSRRKWCPSTPHCGRAVQVFYSPVVEVDCACGVQFCFRCGMTPPHAPATCDMVKKWIKKSQDDSETANWLSSKTKECPKCAKVIEKDGGCNLVTCKCGAYFCWLCGEATGSSHTWTEISGHTCGKYKEIAEAGITKARQALKRYMHYFSHQKAQADSAKAELKLRKDVPRKMTHLRNDTNHSYGAAELAWMQKGVAQLEVARRALENSYVFAYYVFEEDWGLTQKMEEEAKSKPQPKAQERPRAAGRGRGRGRVEKRSSTEAPEIIGAPPPSSTNPLKNIFDDQQEQLEFTTERLSKLLETPVENFNESHIKQIMSYTVLADKRCRGLYDVIQNEILSDGSIIPSYNAMFPQAEMGSYAVSSYTSSSPFSSSSSSSSAAPSIKPPAANPILTKDPPPIIASNNNNNNNTANTNTPSTNTNSNKKPAKDSHLSAEKEAKRKKWDPSSNEYDEDQAIAAALRHSMKETKAHEANKQQNIAPIPAPAPTPAPAPAPAPVPVDKPKAPEEIVIDAVRHITVLRLDRATGEELGAITWFAVHCTSMNNTNKLISSDNKGYAAYLFEKAKNGNRTIMGQGNFVAAFAQSNEGDVSPNTKGPHCPNGQACDFATSTCNGKTEECISPGPGDNMYESTQIIGTNQFKKAMSLFDNKAGAVPLQGPIHFIHTWVNMTNITVDAKFVPTNKTGQTCQAAYGYSFAAGTTDGPGAFDFTQHDNKTSGNVFWDFISSFIAEPTPQQKACQAPKPILLDVGLTKPIPWVPDVVPLQIATIGQLILIAVPGEFTTMSGRRLRDTVKNTLLANGFPSSPEPVPIIVGLANTYTGYIATYEEYHVQRYEGASTIFGPHTLSAYQQEFSKLAVALANGKTVPPGPSPRNLTGQTFSFQADVIADMHPLGKPFGTVLSQPAKSYTRGQVVQVVFQGANPRNDYLTMSSYLTVQLQEGSQWSTILTDADWDTKMHWKRVEEFESQITIEWDISLDAQPGTYRITHQGHYKENPLFETVLPYSGTSNAFTVA